MAGQSVRVVSTAGDDELQGLARVVNRKLAELAPAAKSQPQSLLLVAMALAHDLEQERERRATLEERTRDLLRGLLERVDAAIGDSPSRAARPGAK